MASSWAYEALEDREQLGHALASTRVNMETVFAVSQELSLYIPNFRTHLHALNSFSYFGHIFQIFPSHLKMHFFSNRQMRGGRGACSMHPRSFSRLRALVRVAPMSLGSFCNAAWLKCVCGGAYVNFADAHNGDIMHF